MWFALLGLALAAGVAVAYAVTRPRELDHDPLPLVPRDAIVYLEATLDPSEEQGDALDAILRRFPAAGSASELRRKVIDALDRSGADDDISYEEDIEPWLGGIIAGYVTVPETFESDEFGAAVLVATTDADATRAFIEESSDDERVESRMHRGVSYEVEDDAAYGIVEDFLVFGNELGVEKTVDAVAGGSARSLAGSTKFDVAFEGLESDVLGRAFVNLQPVLEVFRESPEFPPVLASGAMRQIFEQAQGIVVYARSDGVVIDTRAGILDGPLGRGAAAGAGDVISDLPASAWAALGASRFGDTLRGLMSVVGGPVGTAAAAAALERETGLDLERDILSWIGDVALFVRGSGLFSMGGGIVAETLDPAASNRLIAHLGGLLIRDRPSGVARTRRSFSVQPPGVPEPIQVVARSDRVVATYGRDATNEALGDGPRLADDPEFEAAERFLGVGYTPAFYLEIPALVAFVETVVPAGEIPGYAEVRPNLEALLFLASGSRVEGEDVFQRVVIGLS